MIQLAKEHAENRERQLAKAIKNCDVKALGELLHDDLLFNNQDGQIITKMADLEVYESGKLVIDEITQSEQNISIIGDTAITTQLTSLKGTYEEQPFKGRFRYLRVWKLFNDQCKVIAGACTTI